MLAALFLPDPATLQLEQIELAEHQITLTAMTTAAEACCPTCAQSAHRVHSRYTRTVADLPCAARPLRWHLHARRFFCANPACPRRTFAERLPTVVAPAARRTLRQTAQLQQTGLCVGGEVGAHVLCASGIPVSPATVLRAVRRMPAPAFSTPRVLGVDDWALRKGQTYGTILCDLETGQPVDLLADRTAATLAAWLGAHPGVEIISRDRASAYAEGAHRGAPQARQVADRFHILKNLGDALEELLGRLYPELRLLLAPPPALLEAPTIAPAVASPDDAPAGVAASAPVEALPLPVPLPPPPAPSARTAPRPPRQRDVESSQARRRARLARYEEVVRLHRLGWSQVAIATHLGLARKTVSHWLHHGCFPERQHPGRRRSKLDSYQAYLQERWAQGCHNAQQLWRELRGRGYRGGHTIVRDYLAGLRPEQGGLARSGAAGGEPRRKALQLARPRQLKWLLLRPVADLTDEEYTTVRQLCQHSKEVTLAYGLVMDFQDLVRGHQAEHLDNWVKLALASGVEELASFARGVLRDFAAVYAGLELAWSNGPVEGQVNRLKMLKRQMYGRAKLDLLRRRVLYAH